MVKTIAPLRISFAGGGTDIEPYASEHGGIVLSAAIKIYAEAEYPATKQEYSMLEKTIIRYFKLSENLSVISNAEPMSGLGGSAACFVAGIKAAVPELPAFDVANIAFRLERKYMRVAGGIQDQYIAAYGGMNYLTINEKGVHVEAIKIPEGLEQRLLLVYLGRRNHSGADIIKDQMKRDNLENFRLQKQIAESMKLALKQGGIRTFGAMIEMAWQSKVRFSPLISTDDIKEFHKNCLNNGAIGGKLTGAGGGGYMLLMEDPDKPNELRKYLEGQKIGFNDVLFEMEGVRCVKK